MINEIRFILSEHDKEFEKLLLEEMKPFISDKDVIEENGDAGTTITIIFTIIQTALALPGFVIAMHQLICYTKQKSQGEQIEKEYSENSNSPWKFMIDGHTYDLSGLPSDEEKIRVFDLILSKHLEKDD